MNMKRFFKNVLNTLDNVLTLGYAKRSREKVIKDSVYPMVTAGDPCVYLRMAERSPRLGAEVRTNKSRIKTSDYTINQVLGNSMSPMDICNGDYLLSVPYHANDNIVKGTYLVIAVDKDYYRRFKFEEAIFDMKLRRSLLKVEPGRSLDQIISDLKDTNHEEIFLPKNQEMLAEKYSSARKAYPADELMLSTTYKNGSLRYSFHPIRLIRYIAKYRVEVKHGEVRMARQLKSA